MVIKGFDVVQLLKKTGREVGEDRITSLAAQTAYYFFFSLFPLLLFLTPMLGLFGNGQQLMDETLSRLSSTLPADSLSLIRRIMSEVLTSRGGAGIMSMGALLAAWSGSNIFGALMDALNIAYDVEETRPWWQRQLLRLGALVVAAVIMLLATATFLDGSHFAQWLGSTFGLGTAALRIIGILQLLVAAALLVGLAALLFRLLPNVKQRWSNVVAAAIVTTLLWVIATLLFRVYVQHFGSYNKTYGTIGGVIALLTWMYYSMFVLLCGGELASEMHHGSGAVAPARGVVYHGRIVSDAHADSPSMSTVQRPE
jgi:membrane protein